MGQTQSIAAQATMLPGLHFALTTALDNYNDARLALKMEPLFLSNAEALKQTAENANPTPRHASPKRRKMSKEAKDKLRAATQERWDLVRRAGIKMAGRVPSAAEVDRARKLIARRSTTTAKATKPARAVAARKKAAASAAAA